jgi:predicted DNA binding CopG/RHH family protein
MTAFFFDVPDVPPQRTAQQEQYHRILMEKARRLSEYVRQEKEEEARQAAMPTSRLVTFRIPTTLLTGLDQLAKSKGFSRGHMLRHITAVHIHNKKESECSLSSN